MTIGGRVMTIKERVMTVRGNLIDLFVKGEYRLRAGKYRVIFFIENENIYIVKVDTRGDIYKR